jgi:hypothetical protein
MSPMGDEATAHSEQERSKPARGNRLQEEVTELQERWEALGEELEAKRRRLTLAEATVELMQQGDKAAAPKDGVAAKGAGKLRSEDEEYASHAAQASIGIR